VQDLRLLLEELNWNHIILIGHSLGGYVSYLFAKQYPHLIQKMIIMDSSPWPIELQRRKIEDILLSLPSLFQDESEAKIFFKEAIDKKILSKTIADFLNANLDRSSEGHLKFLFDKEGLLELLKDIRTHNIPAFIKNIQTPTLIMRGENSRHFLSEDFEKTLQLNSLFIGKEIKNCGHWIHSEQPKAFIKCVKEFLSQEHKNRA